MAWRDNHPSSLTDLGPLLLRPRRVQPALDELGEEEVAEEELVLGHGAARDDEGERPLGLVVQHQGLCFGGLGGWGKGKLLVVCVWASSIQPQPLTYLIGLDRPGRFGGRHGQPPVQAQGRHVRERRQLVAALRGPCG